MIGGDNYPDTGGDPNDDMFITCAIPARIEIIISGDLDLLEISGYQNIQVLKPRQFYDYYLVSNGINL